MTYLARCCFEDSRGKFDVFADGSVKHYHNDGGSFTEFTGSHFADFKFLCTQDLTEEDKGKEARELIRAGQR